MIGTKGMVLTRHTDSLGLLNMAGIRGYPPSAFHAAKNGRSRNDHDTLSLRSRCVQSALHTQLDLSILLRGAQVL